MSELYSHLRVVLGEWPGSTGHINVTSAGAFPSTDHFVCPTVLKVSESAGTAFGTMVDLESG